MFTPPDLYPLRSDQSVLTRCLIIANIRVHINSWQLRYQLVSLLFKGETFGLKCLLQQEDSGIQTSNCSCSAFIPPLPLSPCSPLSALYSPVRAVPLRPRLHSPNGHRAASPRPTSALQPIAAAPSSHACPISRPLAGLKTMLGPSQSQHSSLPVTNPMSVSSHLERSPSAARQLQIIALSSGRQPQPGTFTHAVQPARPVVEPPELSSQSKRSGEDTPPVPLNPTLPKTTSPLPSPPSLLSPTSPPSQAGPQTQTVTQKVEAKPSEEQRDRGRGLRPGGWEEGSVKDTALEKDDQRLKVKEEKLSPEREVDPISQKEQEVETVREEEQMEVMEEGQRDRERAQEKKMEDEEEGETAMDQSENLTGQILHQYRNRDPTPTPEAVKDSPVEPKPVLGLISAPVPAPVPVPVPAPVPEVPVQSQRLPESNRDLQPVSQEDFCENMSTQSDNQSGTASLTCTATCSRD